MDARPAADEALSRPGPAWGSAQRLFRADGPSLAAHTAAYGARPRGRGLVAAVADAGVLGRGGAGFPSHRKLAAVAAAGSAVVVANGAEGEPASEKDAVLLTHAPQLVFDGLALAAGAVGAKKAYLVTSRAELLEPLDRANAERSDRVPVSIELVEDRFVSGEESAVVSALNAGPGVPTDRLTRVYERGVGGRATLVNNVETLAQLALVARYGADWFRSVGTAAEPGTFLATLGGSVGSPGVYEVAFGSSLGEVLRVAGVEGRPDVLVGGYHGGWVPAGAVGEVRLTRDHLAPYGASVGSGVIWALPERQCPLVASAKIADYLAGQSAGQCGPCVNGLPALADALTTLAGVGHGSDGRAVVHEAERLSALVTGRGACLHPDGTARLVRSTLRVFAREIDLHGTGRCRADS